MTERLKNVVDTPAVVASVLKRGVRSVLERLGSRSALLLTALLLALIILVLLAAMWRADAPRRALQGFERADYNRSAALYESIDGNAARYNAANAWYRAGGYEQALALYSAIDVREPLFAARVWYNRGNTLVRLKEFEKARQAYARSLALSYDDEALENMLHILDAESQDHMLTGRQEGKKRAQEQREETTREGNKKPKEGGGSNQQSSAERNQGAGAQGKKVERESQLEFSDKGKSRLSSKQYELINQRSVHETKPW